MGQRRTSFLCLLKILLSVTLLGSSATVVFLMSGPRHMHTDFNDKDIKEGRISAAAKAAFLEGTSSKLNSNVQYNLSELPEKTTQITLIIGSNASAQQQRVAAFNRTLGKSEIVKRNSHVEKKPVLSKNISQQDDALKSRLLRVMSNCRKLGFYDRNRSPGSQFYLSLKHRLLFCKVAKGGCTFWESIFAFINNPSLMAANKFSRISDIPRWRIHFDGKMTQPINMWQQVKAISGLNPDITRFFFTRDPFSRVWSAFLDKIWLPDFWDWLPIGSHKSSGRKDRCLSDVTFEVFMRHVSVMNDHNPHWAPVHESCNPCVFMPDVIGNMSTFVSDAISIMSTSGIQEELSNFSHEARVQTELQMLVEYNYARYAFNQYTLRYCNFTKMHLAFRLWKTFQINGYISKDLDFPEDLQSYDERTILKTIRAVQAKLPLTLSESREQRNYFMKEAFHSVPRDVIDQFVRKFHADFVLFDFNPNPDFLPNPE